MSRSDCGARREQRTGDKRQLPTTEKVADCYLWNHPNCYTLCLVWNIYICSKYIFCAQGKWHILTFLSDIYECNDNYGRLANILVNSIYRELNLLGNEPVERIKLQIQIMIVGNDNQIVFYSLIHCTC